jgi:hypothetical protein
VVETFFPFVLRLIEWLIQRSISTRWTLQIECRASMTERGYAELLFAFANPGPIAMVVRSARVAKPKNGNLSDTTPLVLDFEVQRVGPVASEIELGLSVGPEKGKRTARLHLLPPENWTGGKVKIVFRLETHGNKVRHWSRSVKRVLG